MLQNIPNSIFSNNSGKTLTQKLGIDSETRMLVINAPKNYFELLPDLPDTTEITLDQKSLNLNFIQFFVSSWVELQQILPKLKQQILKNGTIWVTWPKLNSGFETDLNEQKVRQLSTDLGLLDVNFCSIDLFWEGLKLVYRVDDIQFKQFLELI